jgi:rubredoxin
MDKYQCMLCGHVYDPAEGDSTQGIAPDTKFEELPESWICPDCGAPKDQYGRCDGRGTHYSAVPIDRNQR